MALVPKNYIFERLLKRAGATHEGKLAEVILATNLWWKAMPQRTIWQHAPGHQSTRIARGLPVGGELEQVDSKH